MDPLSACLGAFTLAEALKIKIAERDDIADLLALIPQWVFGALFWVAISELVLKRAYPNDFIKLQTAILGADIVGEMPPGVAIVAAMYDTLYAIDIAEGFKGWIVESGDAILDLFGIPKGFFPIPVPVNEE